MSPAPVDYRSEIMFLAAPMCVCVCLSACVFAAALVPGRAAAHGLSRTISPHSTAADTIYVGPWMAGVLVAAAAAAAVAALVAATTYIPHTLFV